MTDTNALLHVLEGLRLRSMTATYKAVADAIGLTPPGQIQALAALLEAIQEDDARLGRPQRASGDTERQRSDSTPGVFPTAHGPRRLPGQ